MPLCIKAKTEKTGRRRLTCGGVDQYHRPVREVVHVPSVVDVARAAAAAL